MMLPWRNAVGAKKTKKKEDDAGEDALVLAFKRTKQSAEQAKETKL